MNTNVKILGILEYEKMKKEDNELKELELSLFSTGRYGSRQEARIKAKEVIKRRKNNEILANEKKNSDTVNNQDNYNF